MISAAEVITLAVPDRPVTTDCVAVAGCHVFLPDSGEQEHLVVHREPEEDGEHHQWHERDDRHRVVRAPISSLPQPHWNTATITP